jgi:hypothetical protein
MLLGIAIIVLATTMLFTGGPGARIAYFVGLLCAEILLSWFYLLSPEEREIGTGFVLRLVRDV